MNTGLSKPELAEYICTLLIEYDKWREGFSDAERPTDQQECMVRASLWWDIIKERLKEYREL